MSEKSDPNEALSSTDRKYLRGLAHELRPVVHLGKNGLSDAVAQQVSASLDSHELIKVKLVGDRDERTELSTALAERVDAQVAGVIGGVAILFRRQRDPEKRRITIPGEELPKKAAKGRPRRSAAG